MQRVSYMSSPPGSWLSFLEDVLGIGAVRYGLKSIGVRFDSQICFLLETACRRIGPLEIV
jgi:hypothetical protein